MKQTHPHSAEVLTDWRDSWWNRDYLELATRRLRLAEAHDVVDVGCGKGHWSRCLRDFLRPEVNVVGVDRAPEWVEEATQIAHRAGLERWRYVTGTAEALPLPDESADVVTCQTVLMHVASPEVAVREMLRVLRPGGLLLAAEPSNLAPQLTRNAVTMDYSPARLGRIAEFQAAMRAGRIALGEGDECIGDRLPQLLADCGLTEITASQNDRLNPILAPHDPETAERALGPFTELTRKRLWRFERAAALRLYEAGDGTPERFDTLFAEFLEQADATVTRLDAGTFWTAMGQNHYLISGRK